MKPTKAHTYFIFLTLLNLGILFAVAWATWGQSEHTTKNPKLTEYLQLNAQQITQWHAAEQGFLVQLRDNESAIETQRNALIEAIFHEELALENVHQARENLAHLQNQQQKIVVEQLLTERQILTTQQRSLLQHLLQQQSAETSHYEQLHTNQ